MIPNQQEKLPVFSHLLKHLVKWGGAFMSHTSLRIQPIGRRLSEPTDFDLWPNSRTQPRSVI